MLNIDKIERYRYLVSGYFGIRELDEYDLKPYILLEIEDFIKNYIYSENIESMDLKKEADLIETNHTKREKLNNSLIILKELDAPIDLIVLVKRNIVKLKK